MFKSNAKKFRMTLYFHISHSLIMSTSALFNPTVMVGIPLNSSCIMNVIYQLILCVHNAYASINKISRLKSETRRRQCASNLLADHEIQSTLES